jgi:hypothetical protein
VFLQVGHTSQSRVYLYIYTDQRQGILHFFDCGSVLYEYCSVMGLLQSSTELTAFGTRPYDGRGMNGVVLNCKHVWRLKKHVWLLTAQQCNGPTIEELFVDMCMSYSTCVLS